MVVLNEREGYKENLEILNKLLEMRQEPLEELGQRYLTRGALLNRIEILISKGLLEGKRILSIGDDDFTGLACSIFGNPSEVLVVDIDRRLSEILFEANMQFNLPVRFLYHDLRIKIIEVLRHRYSVILIEPPWTKAGVEVFISRSLECLAPGSEEGLVISIPHDGEIREFFDDYIRKLGFVVTETFVAANKYENTIVETDLLMVKVPVDSNPTITTHWLDSFYESEVNQDIKGYKCKCGTITDVGPKQSFGSLESLKSKGCPNCGAREIFVFDTKVKME